MQSNEFDEGTILLRFGVLSDCHIGMEPGPDDQKLQKLLRAFQRMAGGAQSLPAVAIAGDLTKRGSQQEIRRCGALLREVLSPEWTELFLTPGNHEVHKGAFVRWNPYYDELRDLAYRRPLCPGKYRGVEGEVKKEYFRSWDFVHGNYHTVIGGFHFISVFDYDNDNFPTDLLWLYRHLRLAQQDAPEKPIFVFGHCHAQDTCYGSSQVKAWQAYKHAYHWTTNNLSLVLGRFPQVVFFSGHTHFPVADERSIWQGSYTAVNTGSSSYMSIEEGYAQNGASQEFADSSRVSNGLFVEVDHALRIRVTRLTPMVEGEHCAQIKQPWVFPTMHRRSAAVYTGLRGQRKKRPVFPHAQAYVKPEGEIGPRSAQLLVRFGTASDPSDMVHHYEARIIRDGSKETLACAKKLAPFYLYPQPEEQMPVEEQFVRLRVDGLEPGSPYQVRVTACDSWGNESVPLMWDFRTPQQ